MIIGLGIDLVYIPRIERLFLKYGENFLKRAFHPKEIQTFYSIKNNNNFQFLAGR